MNISRRILAASAALLAISASAQEFIPEGFSSDTKAFFSFTGYENGTKWVCPDPVEYASKSYTFHLTAMSNHLDSARYVQAFTACNGYVTVTNETPGRYLYSSASAKVPLVSEYMSVRPVTIGTTRRTWLQFDNAFSKDIAMAGNGGGFTLEMFVKNDSSSTGNAIWFDIGSGAGSGSYRVLLQFPVSDATSNSVCACSSFTDSASGIKNNSVNNYSSVEASSDLRDSKWHHIALVYEQPDSSTNGYMRLYLDYKASGRVFYVQRETDPTKPFGVFRMGEQNVGWMGMYSALRLTAKALSADEFLHVSNAPDGCRVDKTIGFYPFDEVEPGYVFTVANKSGMNGAERTLWDTNYFNQAASAAYSAFGGCVSLGVKHASGVEPNPEFYTTNDVPARYVYSGLRAKEPIRELKASLATLGKTKAGNMSDWIRFDEVPYDLWDSDSYTVEFFVKFLSEPGLFAFWDLGPSEKNRFTLGRSGADAVYLKFNSSSKTATYPDLTTFVDGKWHHIAVVCDENMKAKLYCDYTLVSAELPFSKGTTRSGISDAFRLSEGSQSAQFSCFRATAAALEPKDFLYASDSPNGVLSVGAEWCWHLDGTIGDAVASAANAISAIDPDQYVFKDGHAFTGSLIGSGSAVYADPVMKGRRVLEGVRGDKNRSAAVLNGRHFVAGVGGVLCDPGCLFTVEALANVETPASGSATLFGAENAAGAAAWRLSVDEQGALWASFRNAEDELQSFKVMDGFAGAPHHVAITADLLMRMAFVYVDYVERRAFSASDFALPLANDGVHFVLGGGCGGSEINGAVDEIRCVHALISLDGLSRFIPDGMTIILR